MAKRAFGAVLMLAAALSLGGCDRNIEPFVPNEKPVQPDLSRIFPEGASSAKPAQPGLPLAPGAVSPMRAAAEPASAAPLMGTIRLAASLESGAPPDSVLFIIARRAAAGPPLAVKRIRAPSFPLEFTLGPEDRMIPSIPFEGPLQLTVRVDQDGNATSRSPGDLSGAAAGSFEPGARDIDIVIDQVF